MAKQSLMIIDGHALLHRAWHAIPPLTTKDGRVVNAVYGFTSILLKAMSTWKPQYVVVTFDTAVKTFRHESYKAYKATRVRQPDEFYNQIPLVQEVVSALGIPIWSKDGFEADDVIATICHLMTKKHPEVEKIIVTGDTDTLQLVDDHTKVFSPRKGIADTIIYDREMVKEKFEGLLPVQLRDLKSLRGDSSDNIKGVSGIGEKTAMQLVKEFGSLEKILLAAKKSDSNISDRVKKLLLDGAKDAQESYDLVTLVRDVPIDFQLDKCKFGNADYSGLIKIIQDLEFTSLLPRIQELPGMSSQPTLFSTGQSSRKKINAEYIAITSELEAKKFVAELKKQKEFAVDTETTSLDHVAMRLVGASVSWQDERAYYLPWANTPASAKKALLSALKDKNILKVGHNLKYDLQVFANENIFVSGPFFDTMVAAYILNPGVRGYGLDELSFTEFGYQKISIESL